MSRPIFHHLFQKRINFFHLPGLGFRFSVCCIVFYSPCTQNMLRYVNYARVIYKRLLAQTLRAHGTRDYRRQERQTRREHNLLTTTTTRTEEREKTQTQHAWLIRDNVGVPIVANIRINQWQTAALAPVCVQKPFGLILSSFFAFCSREPRKIAWISAGKWQWVDISFWLNGLIRRKLFEFRSKISV